MKVSNFFSSQSASIKGQKEAKDQCAGSVDISIQQSCRLVFLSFFRSFFPSSPSLSLYLSFFSLSLSFSLSYLNRGVQEAVVFSGIVYQTFGGRQHRICTAPRAGCGFEHCHVHFTCAAPPNSLRLRRSPMFVSGHKAKTFSKEMSKRSLASASRTLATRRDTAGTSSKGDPKGNFDISKSIIDGVTTRFWMILWQPAYALGLSRHVTWPVGSIFCTRGNTVELFGPDGVTQKCPRADIWMPVLSRKSLTWHVSSTQVCTPGSTPRLGNP